MKLEHIKGGKVTFGDGGQGKIRGVGVMERADLPRLINVYFVNGNKANLISVSQLCDEGLEVIFNSKECVVLSIQKEIWFYSEFAQGTIAICGSRHTCVCLLVNINLISGTRNLVI